MSLTASGLTMNWTGVTVTPPSPGLAITVDKVLDIKVDGKSVQKMFFGDNFLFATHIRNVQKSRSLEIVGGNIGKLLALPDDAIVTIVAVLNDVDNGVSTGAITVTLINAKREGFGVSGQNNEYGKGSVKFNAAGGASDADPLSVAIAS